MGCLVLITKQNKKIVASVKQSGSFTVLDDAFEVGSPDKVVTYNEVYLLINSGEVLTFGASLPLEEGIKEKRHDVIIDTSELFEVTKATAVFILVSTINNVVLASGTREKVNETASLFSLDSAKVAIGVSWYEGAAA